ncbi:MAG TPA: FAD-dependent oxidoreductase, partial [Clostridiales bacterium]|nr:FAD-dependent oxidoreductase [Clostridiales bacterium]
MKQNPESVSKTLIKHGILGVECSEKRKSIRLEGELADWAQIVKAGKLAAKAGYKGVINDIRLAGFDPPAVRQPETRDASLEGRAPDVLIIGGGVIGCSIARELSRYKLDILLCDKESDVAMHASSRNDGMIHPGIASHPGTLRGDMNVLGNAMYTDICRDLSIPFERYGSLILYSERWFGLLSAPIFAMREKKFGIEGRKISRKTLHQLEPNITDEAVGAFEYPSSGVLSPYKLTAALADNAIENSASVSLDTMVESMETEHGRITAVKTNRGTLRPRVVVNAAGVFSDVIAEMADDRFFTIHPRKGECVILDKKKGPLVTRSMGLV